MNRRGSPRCFNSAIDDLDENAGIAVLDIEERIAALSEKGAAKLRKMGHAAVLALDGVLGGDYRARSKARIKGTFPGCLPGRGVRPSRLTGAGLK